VEVDVVLLHRFAAVIDFLMFLTVFGDDLPAHKGSYRFLVREDAI